MNATVPVSNDVDKQRDYHLSELRQQRTRAVIDGRRSNVNRRVHLRGSATSPESQSAEFGRPPIAHLSGGGGGHFVGDGFLIRFGSIFGVLVRVDSAQDGTRESNPKMLTEIRPV